MKDKFYIIVDIDGTIADNTERLHLIKENNPPKWDEFFKACGSDKPIQNVIDIINTLDEYYEIIYCTGRSEICRKETEQWLKDNHSYYSFNEKGRPNILMRKQDDYRGDHIVKPELLDEYLSKYNINKNKVKLKNQC
jgi:predicted secreted acid phosphatase